MRSSAAVEVACWWSEHHNTHPARDERWEVSTAGELVEAFSAAVETVKGRLAGPHDPHTWRIHAGLPDAPID